MTVYKTPQNTTRPYRTASEVRREAPAPRTDEQIRAAMKESVKRNAATLQTLSKL